MVSHVATKRERLVAALAELSRNVDDLLFVARGDRHRRPCLGKCIRRCGTHSPSTTGYDSSPSSQIQTFASSPATTASASSSPRRRTVLRPSSAVAWAGHPK